MTAPPHPPPAIAIANLRPVSGARFALLDDMPIVFSEADQKIFELNKLAAYIWCCLENRISAEIICDNLVASGLDGVTAKKHVHSALRDWLALGLIEPTWTANEQHAFSVNVGKLSVRIRASSEQLVELLAPIFICSDSDVADQEVVDVVESHGLVSVFHNGDCVFRSPVNELAPILKAYFTEQAIQRSGLDVAFHAACMLFEGRGLLLSGPPGAGKTTLALHLLDAGFTYGADDVALIAPDGTATGLMFAPSVKSGSWPIVDSFRPDLDAAAIHCRPDGKRVRYLKMGSDLHHDKFPVGWIIFINRSAEHEEKLTELGELETVRRLIDGSCSSNGRLTRLGFSAVKSILASARSFELHYSDAGQATRTIIDLCNGKI